MVREDGFSITLNFGDQPEPIQTFDCPNIQHWFDQDNLVRLRDAEPRQEAEVVSLDFRHHHG